MANRMFRSEFYTLNPKVVKLFGSVTVGSSGAISSQSCKGFSVALTDSETGRYTVTLADTYNAFLGCQVTPVVATDAAIGTSAGFIATVRNVSVADSTPTFDIQFSDAAGADADPASGVVFYLEISLQNSSITR